MKTAIRVCLTVFLLVIATGRAAATWSIIVVDPQTKEIGIAGASCTYSVYGIGAIAPGKGAIVVQAMSNAAARKKGLQMIMADVSPEEILAAIKDPDFDPEEQQYAVVCVNFLQKPLTYTGASTTPHKGAATGNGISVQGNTLADPGAVKAIYAAVLQAQKKALRIEEVLMLALEAGAKAGGDKRCGTTMASSAFLTVAKPGDDRRNPYLNLVIYGTNEAVPAVDALRKKLEQWKEKQH